MRAGPEVQPNSDGHFLHGSEGEGGDHGLASPGFVIIGAVEGGGGGAAGAGAGGDVDLVDEEVAGAFGLAEGGVEEGHGAEFAAEDGSFIELGGVDGAADLGVGADAFGGAVDGGFRFFGADEEFNV